MLTQAEIDDVTYGRYQEKQEPPAPWWRRFFRCVVRRRYREVPGEALVEMMRRAGKEKGIKVRVVKVESIVQKAGVFVMGFLAVLVAVHIVVWAVKP